MQYDEDDDKDRIVCAAKALLYHIRRAVKNGATSKEIEEAPTEAGSYRLPNSQDETFITSV